MFTTDTIEETDQVIASMLEMAQKNKKKRWYATAVEKYTGLYRFLHKNHNLSDKQCMIIYEGCRMNDLVCPAEIEYKATGKYVKRPEPKDPDLFDREIVVTESELQVIFEYVGVELGRGLAKKIFDVLEEAKK